MEDVNVNQNAVDFVNRLNENFSQAGGSGSPAAPSSRHILWIGNSFTSNGREYLMGGSGVCTNLGLSTRHSLQTIITNSATLQHYAGKINSAVGGAVSTKNGEVWGSGSGFDIKSTMTLTQIFSFAWDVIVFQQGSNVSDDYSSYKPYLAKLINCVLENCPNKDVKIMFNMTWGTDNTNSGGSVAPFIGYTDTSGGSSTYVPGILDAVKSMMEDFGHIITVIPSGTAIENLRGTSLNAGDEDYLGFTPDNQHLAEGAGRYVAALIIFQCLFGDLVEKTLYDDTKTVANPGNYNGSAYGKLAVTSENRKTLQECAMYAYINPWRVTDIDGL